MVTKGKPKEPVLDFSGVTPFRPLDESQLYLAKVTNCTIGTGPSGYDKASVELTISKPEEVEVEIEGKVEKVKAVGRKLFREYSFSPAALPFLHEFLTALGETELGENFKFVPAKYIGLDCAVRIQNEEFEEQIRARVRKVLPAFRYTS